MALPNAQYAAQIVVAGKECDDSVWDDSAYRSNSSPKVDYLELASRERISNPRVNEAKEGLPSFPTPANHR
jgi:hypothetical protein